jgi:2-oxoglutarate dehydrogenase complex dehydrogenase (E1) component-like enzyme
MPENLSQADLDRLRTFQEAAEALELPYFKIQRAARRKIIPTYSILNSRKYVKLRDILAAMHAA